MHGWPVPGVFYDASAFQVEARNRIETEQLRPTEAINVNTGNTRSRGVEMQGSFDLLRLMSPTPGDRHLTLFANASLLDAKFTGSAIPGQIGKTPARIPSYVVADLSGEYMFAGHWRVMGGVANLTDRRYYSRVFLFGGMLEPALTRQFYAGVRYDL